MKRFLKAAAIFITALVILFAGFFVYLMQGLAANSQPNLQGATANGLRDGVYDGGYNAGRFTNRVTVTVSDGRITDIIVAQDVLFPQEHVTRALFQRVVDANSTKVDVVSGSTITSNAYLQSIENALIKKGD